MKKQEKEPNLKLSLAAAALFAVMIIICLIDFIKQQIVETTALGIIMIVFMGACFIAIAWIIWYIIKRIKSEKR